LGFLDFNMTIKPFPSNKKFQKYVTRITDYNSVLEFVKKNSLHFSPLSSFEDFTEGKRFEDIALSEEEEFKDINSSTALFRRKVMYASCWHNGKESLLMWNLYGRNERYLAIQMDYRHLVNLFSAKFTFESKSLNNLRIAKDTKISFLPGSLHYGKVEYVNLLKISEKKKNYFLGRFKDKAFHHEKEFRLLLRQNYKESYLVDLRDLKCVFTGSDFKQLKLKIIVSPCAPDFYYDMIKSQLKNYQNITVCESKYKKLFL
jgi:hypothetical protein